MHILSGFPKHHLSKLTGAWTIPYWYSRFRWYCWNQFVQFQETIVSLCNSHRMRSVFSKRKNYAPSSFSFQTLPNILCQSKSDSSDFVFHWSTHTGSTLLRTVSGCGHWSPPWKNLKNIHLLPCKPCAGQILPPKKDRMKNEKLCRFMGITLKFLFHLPKTNN